MSDHDRGTVWHDENGKLVSYCTCCKQHHADADNDPAVTSLVEALDLIEEEQWSASDDFENEQCPWCFELKCDHPSEPGGHALDCKAALLLRKHGRQVRFQGES